MGIKISKISLEKDVFFEGQKLDKQILRFNWLLSTLKIQQSIEEKLIKKLTETQENESNSLRNLFQLNLWIKYYKKLTVCLKRYIKYSS